MRKLYIAMLLGLVIFSSCGSSNAVLKDEQMKKLPVSKMMERAVANYVAYDFKSAIAYYEAIIKYYPEDYDNVAWANYEIGFMHWKDNKYKKAKKRFLTVVNAKVSADAPKLLATKMLLKIKKKLSKKKPEPKKTKDVKKEEKDKKPEKPRIDKKRPPRKGR